MENTSAFVVVPLDAGWSDIGSDLRGISKFDECEFDYGLMTNLLDAVMAEFAP